MIPPLVEEETPLPSTDGVGGQTHTGRRSHKPIVGK
jgi:hypothetical protein